MEKTFLKNQFKKVSSKNTFDGKYRRSDSNSMASTVQIKYTDFTNLRTNKTLRRTKSMRKKNRTDTEAKRNYKRRETMENKTYLKTEK